MNGVHIRPRPRVRSRPVPAAFAATLSAAALAASGCDTFPLPGLPGLTDADVVLLRVGGVNQYLVPVQIGSQTLHLLLDTGARSLLVFDDLITPDNTQVRRTDESVSLLFGAGPRIGVVGHAPVRIGRRSAESMRIMLIQTPDSRSDPSLAVKRADGILGLRFNPGGIRGETDVNLDIPLLALKPRVFEFELDLPEGLPGTLVLGATPVVDSADPLSVFSSRTTIELGEDRVEESYADLEVPFQISSRLGVANADDLDILLDTGAVSELVLDRRVAQRIGWNPETRRWNLPDDEELDLVLVGTTGLLPIRPPFRVGQVRVASLASATFDAVLGIDRWQNYVVGFTFLDFALGGPDGTFRFISRSDLLFARRGCALPGPGFVPLPGLNSEANDTAPGLSADATTLAFGSDRSGGRGGLDVYVYRIGQGLLDLPDLNSPADDLDPSLNEDGSLVLFTSNRSGNFDLYLFDIPNRRFIDLPNLNSPVLERSPFLSANGRWVGFRSERNPDNTASPSDVFLYDRQTASLVDLPGLNTDFDEFSPTLTRDAELIGFDALHRPGGQGNDDVYLYDRRTLALVQLPNVVNSGAFDAFAGISPDGRYLAYVTEGDGRASGPQFRDLRLFDREGIGPAGGRGRFIELSGLNSPLEEGEPSLSDGARFIAFHSRRCGGAGGFDIYLYRTALP